MSLGDALIFLGPAPNTPEAREDFAKRARQSDALHARRRELLASYPLDARTIAAIDIRLARLAMRSLG